MADQLVWTQEIPKVDGLYLVREVGDNIYQTEAAVVDKGQIHFYCHHCTKEVVNLSRMEGLEFSGPVDTETEKQRGKMPSLKVKAVMTLAKEYTIDPNKYLAGMSVEKILAIEKDSAEMCPELFFDEVTSTEVELSVMDVETPLPT